MSETRTVDVIELFRKAALEIDNRKLGELHLDTVISDVGLDSVAVMELVRYFEEQLDVRMPDEDLARIYTIGDLARLVARLLPPGVKVAALR